MEAWVVIGRLALRLGLNFWSVKLWWDLFAATFVAHTAGVDRLLTGGSMLFTTDLLVNVVTAFAPLLSPRFRSLLARIREGIVPSAKGS
jgi:hypothetical protein